MKTDRNIAYVGTLQDLGRPYSMLFIDRVERQLYIFVRLSDGSSNRFLAADVSPHEVESYMSEDIGLVSILNSNPCRFATIDGDNVSIDNENLRDFIPTDRMIRMNMFDPELCDDDVWLEVFLKRLNSNQPIEMA
jgi:hypothetical protein